QNNPSVFSFSIPSCRRAKQELREVPFLAVLKGGPMPNINEIPPFPNPGVRLVKEDEHIAIWEEVFEPGKPTAPHRHTRDYIFTFPNGGELTIAPLAGKEEESIVLAGEVQEQTT